MTRKKTSDNLIINLEDDLYMKNDSPAEQPRENKKVEPSMAIYSKISFSFLCSIILVAAFILYFSFSKISVKVYPKQDDLSVNFDANVVSGDSDDTNALKGKILDFIIEEEKAFTPAGTQKTFTDVAGGKVKIINNTYKSQILVATTRFLTANGELFRSKTRVVVPAKGSIEAEVYADKPGAEYEIGPAKFTIPGLWVGLQDKIYAESSESMKREVLQAGIVSAEDITKAEEEIKNIILEKAKAQFSIEVDNKEYLGDFTKEDITSFVSEKAGAEAKQFTAKAKIRIVGVFVTTKDLQAKAAKVFQEKLPQNKALLQSSDKIGFTIKKYNLEERTAVVAVSAERAAMVSENSVIFDKAKLVGMSRQEVSDYFAGFDGVEKTDVEFSPFWVWKVPSSLERISIEIVK